MATTASYKITWDLGIKSIEIPIIQSKVCDIKSLRSDCIWSYTEIYFIFLNLNYNTGCFITADITSGINRSPFYWSSKAVLLDTWNSKVYNFIHMTRWDQRSNKTWINDWLFIWQISWKSLILVHISTKFNFFCQKQ